MRSFFMNVIFFAAVAVLIFPSISIAQPGGYLSVCLDLEKNADGALLTICDHESGMTAIPQPRLYLRVFSDGRVEYERNSGVNNTLERKRIRVTSAEVQEIAGLGIQNDFQKANEIYPEINRGIDSSKVTTVIYHGPDGDKKIVLKNYWAGQHDNYKHYPASLNTMMDRAAEIWERAVGVVKPIPSITFCELVNNRRQYMGNRVSVYVDLDHTGEQPLLSDHECTMAANISISKIDVGVNEIGKKYGSISGLIKNVRAAPAYGWAGVLATGRLRNDGVEDFPKYRFDIEEFKNIFPIILPFQGELEAGWLYADAFDHVTGDGIKLSSGLKPRIHHASRIEWTNVEKFPSLMRSGRKFITFRVVSVSSKQGEKYQWRTVYECEIIELK